MKLYLLPTRITEVDLLLDKPRWLSNIQDATLLVKKCQRSFLTFWVLLSNYARKGRIVCKWFLYEEERVDIFKKDKKKRTFELIEVIRIRNIKSELKFQETSYYITNEVESIHLGASNWEKSIENQLRAFSKSLSNNIVYIESPKHCGNAAQLYQSSCSQSRLYIN
ncbi:hypothetical protein NPIL_630071 [Nephila pilipes]|uniref:Uncharacterized protein n=1 Tax=Nephila pilipes TaxID=299642 RepID=A0A8X6ULW3_NEPPI|nr:hypothetical protein NPIL_630071 [Nephila pilipes]